MPSSPPTLKPSASHAVIFDLDGVLIDSEALQHKAYSTVLQRFGVSVDKPTYARHWIAEGRGPEFAVETYRLPLLPEQLRSEKSGIYFDILRHEVALMSGAPEALKRLEPHFRLAVATNSSRREVEFILQRFELASYFTAIVTREDYANAKPAPDAFLKAAELLQTPPALCLVVEDAQRGVLAAHRAGIKVVVVPNEYTRNSDFSLAERVLNGLSELDAALVDTVLG
ncbi:MAG TPA: HAD family phosphatase [Candidatus Acidoferrales bacterium]|nr:HAD family phosphatase [Candidatus Acidoferrales bacterium]